MNKINLLIKYLLKRTNKYWITLIVFIVITQLIGDNTVMDYFKYKWEIEDIEAEIAAQNVEKEINIAKIDEINGSVEDLEIFAREQYKMAAPDEEIFIIKE
ncbi:MAG: septum formation initiator family protein [Dysgonamonadaceae bacterium]|jgi:cell division protein FtsB|nr:septum formation initiator family protein [Dysgonamonadaceae bacterium]